MDNMTTAPRDQVKPQRVRSRSGRFAPSPDTAERDAEAARLRTRGSTYPEIARALDYADDSGAYRAVQRAIAATITEPSNEVRAVELERLDFMWKAALAVLEAKHFAISTKGVVYLGDQPLTDDGPVLAAIDRMLKIQDRRAKLLGLDAPAKHEVRTVDDVDDAIRRLVDQMAAVGEAGSPAAVSRESPAHAG